MGKKYDVYCVTPEPLCGGEIYLGEAEFNEGLKCPSCGRWTKPGRIKPKNFNTKEGLGYDQHNEMSMQKR